MTHSKSNLAPPISHKPTTGVNIFAIITAGISRQDSLGSIVVLILIGYTPPFNGIKVIMFYGDTVQDTRQLFFISWEKYQQKKLLSPLENEIVQVILAHPEYHKTIENNSKFQEHAYYPELGETNPFLHMGLHLAVREQISTDRPKGMRAVYDQLVKKYVDSMVVEHLIMEQLAEFLWLAQKNNLPPDEQLYLNACSQLCEN